MVLDRHSLSTKLSNKAGPLHEPEVNGGQNPGLIARTVLDSRGATIMRQICSVRLRPMELFCSEDEEERKLDIGPVDFGTLAEWHREPRSGYFSDTGSAKEGLHDTDGPADNIYDAIGFQKDPQKKATKIFLPASKSFIRRRSVFLSNES